MALSPSDLEAVRAAGDALAASFDAPDPTAWVDFYTDDAIFAGPGAPAIEGREALLAIAPQLSMSAVEIVAESIVGNDDYAAAFGRGSWVGASGERVRRRLLMVWRRENGRWRLARELLTDDA